MYVISWREFNATDTELNTLLLQSVDEIYYLHLRNETVGYASITTKDILDHLYTTYGRITAAVLSQNDAHIFTPLDPGSPIMSLFGKFESSMSMSEAGKVGYSYEQVIYIEFYTMFQIGLYTEDCREWKWKAVADKKWQNFKTFFTNAYNELQE